MTIAELIAVVQARMPADANTVDTVKCGDADQLLKGVVVTFMATRTVLSDAVRLGANLVITHEPTFYQHLDDTEWLVGDPVYESKRRFLEEHGLVVWRLHDGIHRHRPDGIVEGVIHELGWEAAPNNIFSLPSTPLAELVALLKARLAIRTVRVVGNMGMKCARVALLVGAAGGRRQILALGRDGADVVVCGESAEWETCEYVRDSAAAGVDKALVILGHANSEEAGVGWLADWIRPALPAGVSLTHLVAGDPFRFV